MAPVAPQLSVVLPAYNGARFVRAAVSSILSQTFSDFELIVVDDASSDGTAEILAELGSRDRRLVVERHPHNRGFREALNTGCRLARGPLVAKMSHDDISLPTRFERQVAFLNTHPDVGVVGGAALLIDSNDTPLRLKKYPQLPGHAAWSMLFFNAIAHPAVMMRRELLDATAAYPAGCQGGTEDYALFSALSRTSRVANLPDVVLKYRVTPGGMTQTLWHQQEAGALKIAREHAASWGVELEDDEVLALRGLSHGRHPPADSVESTARHLDLWTNAVLADPRLTENERRRVRQEAGLKRLVLAASAVRRSPRLSMTLAASALRAGPMPLVNFVVKGGQHLMKGVRRTLRAGSR